MTNILQTGPSSHAGFGGRQNTGGLLRTIQNDTYGFITGIPDGPVKDKLRIVWSTIGSILEEKKQDSKGYYPAFDRSHIESAIKVIIDLESVLGELTPYTGPDEDSPVFFNGEDLPNHIEKVALEGSVQQYLDFLVMRIRTMLSDTRMASIIGTSNSPSLSEWLQDYIGSNGAENGEISIIDLSLVPQDVIHLVVAVISRITFEAIQRYRKLNGEELPTVIVLEEAHTFIRRYGEKDEDITASRMCCETFEKIAREGRKFGLGLLLSSQRPSELSPTVLSQCNTFLLHRIVNDKDQELVKKLVPDNLGNLLKELPVLPTRKAILLGWAAPIPVLVEMNELKTEHCPKSADSKFWDVWTNSKPRAIDWDIIAKDWKNEE